MEPEICFLRKERGGCAWAEITLNRPLKGNALTLPMLEELESHIVSIQYDHDLRAVVIRGNGRFFCTGGDIEAWGNLSPTKWGPTGYCGESESLTRSLPYPNL